MSILLFLIEKKTGGGGGGKQAERESQLELLCSINWVTAKHQFSTEGLLLTHSKHCIVQEKGTPEGV